MERKYVFSQLSISTKLFLILLLPIIALLFFASITVLEKQQQLQHTQNALRFTDITQKFTAVVYQLQKERGLTAGFVGSRGMFYLETLVQQRIQTDAEIKQLSQVFNNMPSYLKQEDIATLLYLNDSLSKLNSIRTEIDQLADRDFFDIYTSIITEVLNIVSFLQQLGIESEQRNIASSYLNILWLEEYSGQERGALNGVFAARKINLKKVSSISSYIASQYAVLNEFYNTATIKHRALLRKALKDIPPNEIKHFRRIAFNISQRHDALYKLQILMGYGGIIHNFKNYVIRGDKKYPSLIKQQLNKAGGQIEIYRLLPNLNSEEEKALNAIQKTLHQYQAHLPTIAAMKKKHAFVGKIDEAVQVDDQFAQNGIRLLRLNITDINPEPWWKLATRRLDKIHQISALIADDLILVFQKREYLIQQYLYLYFIVTGFIIFLSCFIGFKLRSRLVHEIRYIADTMRASQETEQFHHLLKVTGHDEITDMANAFNNLIVERTTAEEKLKLAAKVFSNAQEGIIITDTEGNFVDVNPTFCAITGYSREETIGKNTRILRSEKHDPEFFAEMWNALKKQGLWKSEVWNRKKDGQIYLGMLTISSITDEKGQITHYIALFSDITQDKEQQERLEFMAHYDVLTRLPNRALLADRFNQALAHSKRNKTLLAVCFLDLDDFKPVNDIYGHEIGDRLLIKVAKRIKLIIRDEDTVSRQGGDEFVLLLSNIESFSVCELMLTRIIESLAQPYEIDEHTLSISASIGVTLYPIDNVNLDTLMRHADQAMYQSKLAGRNCYSLFNIQHDKQTIQRNIKLQEIEKAFLNNEFCLFYQPKVNMATGTVFGIEALIRWQHPENGIIPPLKFLPIIEGTELEIRIGNWVINTALNQLNNWNELGIKLEVSVNISSYHLQTSSFFSGLEAALACYPNVDSKMLQLEILESSVLSDLSSIKSIIDTCIQALGVNFAFDDFGTGYSSLTHLRNLPAQTIKIDQAFVRDILDDPNDYAIIDGVIGLANSFNRDVIAEGVETTSHGVMLLLMGCKKAQGYSIAKPMPANDLPAWLTHYSPNKEWIAYANSVHTSKESKIKLLRLSLRQWQRHFEYNIQAMPEDIDHWPILNKAKCHCGVLIKRARQEKLFEEKWLVQFDEAHEVIHDIANDLFNKYQKGNVEAARDGLSGIQIAIDKTNMIMDLCE